MQRIAFQSVTDISTNIYTTPNWASTPPLDASLGNHSSIFIFKIRTIKHNTHQISVDEATVFKVFHGRADLSGHVQNDFSSFN